ncbi:MAG: hypothetical protein CSA49_04185 [Gammaproteobacteria bacterium]|nr:MAG: hypothetical protein CSA49_04185 [Gammaproteobacteria bacterium]
MTEPSVSSKILCSIYRSSKQEGMYIYVPKEQGLEQVPDTLLKKIGTSEHVMDLLLTADRTLARADVNEVMQQLSEQGFYLQMPPGDSLKNSF